MQSKNQTFILPLKNMWILLRNFYILTNKLKQKKMKRKVIPLSPATQIMAKGAAKVDLHLQIVMGLAKWIQRGLEKSETNVLLALFGKGENAVSSELRAGYIKNLRHMILSIFESLPNDNTSGSLMSTLYAIFKSKK